MSHAEDGGSPSRNGLRRRAKEHGRYSRDDVSAMSPSQVQMLVHELQVYQIELQLQNEELLRAQRELAEVRDRYFDLFELAPVGYITVGPNYRVQRCNLSAAAMLGMDRSKVENSPLAALVAEGDRDSCFMVVREALETGRRQTWECAIARPSGDTCYSQLAIAPLDEQMPAAGCRVTLTDITHTKQMEAALRVRNDSLERTAEIRTAELRSIADAAHDAIIVTDSLGTVTYWNPAAERILGYPREEAIGKNFQDLLSAERDAIRPDFPRDVGGETEGRTIETFARRRDGHEIAVSLSVSAVSLHGAWHAVAVLSDISERRRSEEALRASEGKFRSLVESTSDCIWEIDAQGRYTYLSPQFQELTGFSVESFLGRSPLDLMMPDDRAPMQEHLRLHMEGHLPFANLEFPFQRSDGRKIVAEVNAVPVLIPTGEFRGLTGTSRDITGRKQSEEALKRFNENLEQQVQQRTEAIRMLRDVAAMANESQDPLQTTEYCLKQLALQQGWLCGHAWWPTGEDEQILLPCCVYYPPDTDRWDEFRTATLQTQLHRNEGLPGRAIASGRPLWTTQLRRALSAPRAAVAHKLGLITAVAAPVFARGKAVAVLEFFSDRRLTRDARTMDVVTGATLQLGRVIERRDFEEHLLASTEDVRRGIAQDLHDDVGQELTGVSLMAAALAKLNPPVLPSAVKLAANIASTLSRTHEKLRSLCYSAMPMELQVGKLAGALKQLAASTQDNSHIKCGFACEHPDWVFDGRTSTQLYRLVQEAISNAIRHARARGIQITMRQERGDILLTIEDDGKGLPRQLPINQGMGLQTMRYRVGMLGGTLEIGPGGNGGTRVACRVPAAHQSPPAPIAARKSTRSRRKP